MTGYVSSRDDGFPARASARIAAGCDRARQFGRPHAHSHPARLAAVARIFGLDAAALGSARVLEIGCASGGDIIPLAAQHPRGIFIGLESSAAQARRGNERIERLALMNIRILTGDVAAFDWQSRRFDYILCHDAYRYGPAPIRAAILRVIASCLAANGVAYVGCNVLPGWRRSQALRDVLMSRLSADCDAAAQVARSRAFLAALSRWKGPDTLHHRSLRETAADAMEMPDEYFAHEFLRDDQEPETFTRFIEQSAKAGLAYLGDCEIWTMLAENFGPRARVLLQPPADDSPAPMEQSIDNLTGRARRQSLFVHAARSAKIARAVDRSRLEGLHFLGDLGRSDEAASPDAWTFVGAGGRRVSTSSAAARRAFEALIARAPASLSLADLLAAGAPARGALGEDDRAAVVDAVQRAVVAGAIEARAAPVLAASAVSTHPVAPPWCRSDAAAGEGSLASLRHEAITLDVVARTLLPLLDGTRDHAALADALIARAAAGELRFSQDGAAANDPRVARICAPNHVARALDHLRGRALLSPSDQPPGLAAANAGPPLLRAVGAPST